MVKWLTTIIVLVFFFGRWSYEVVLDIQIQINDQIYLLKKMIVGFWLRELIAFCLCCVFFVLFYFNITTSKILFLYIAIRVNSNHFLSFTCFSDVFSGHIPFDCLFLKTRRCQNSNKNNLKRWKKFLKSDFSETTCHVNGEKDTSCRLSFSSKMTHRAVDKHSWPFNCLIFYAQIG